MKDNVPIKPLYDLGIRRFIVVELKPFSQIKNLKDYEDAEIIDILPSHDLGKLISGTMNFDRDDLDFKCHLGELDGKRYIKTLFEKDEAYIAVADSLARMDFEQALQTKSFKKNYATLNDRVNSNLDYIKNLEAKLDEMEI